MEGTTTASYGAKAFGEGGESSARIQARGDGGSDTQGGFLGRVRESAAAQLSTQKNRAVDGIGSAARAVRQSSQQLRDQQHETVAGYIEQAADQLERMSRRLRDKDVGELLEDTQRLARRQPALFVGTAFAIGLLGARFLKSSRDEDDDAYSSRDAYGAAPYARRGADRTMRTGSGADLEHGGSSWRTGSGSATATGTVASATRTSPGASPGRSEPLSGSTGVDDQGSAPAGSAAGRRRPPAASDPERI